VDPVCHRAVFFLSRFCQLNSGRNYYLEFFGDPKLGLAQMSVWSRRKGCGLRRGKLRRKLRQRGLFPSFIKWKYWTKLINAGYIHSTQPTTGLNSVLMPKRPKIPAARNVMWSVYQTRQSSSPTDSAESTGGGAQPSPLYPWSTAISMRPTPKLRGLNPSAPSLIILALLLKTVTRLSCTVRWSWWW